MQAAPRPAMATRKLLSGKDFLRGGEPLKSPRADRE
jgi:hypothetical protein